MKNVEIMRNDQAEPVVMQRNLPQIPIHLIHSLVWISETKVLVVYKDNAVLRGQEMTSDRAGLCSIVEMLTLMRPGIPIVRHGETAAA